MVNFTAANRWRKGETGPDATKNIWGRGGIVQRLPRHLLVAGAN